METNEEETIGGGKIGCYPDWESREVEFARWAVQLEVGTLGKAE